MRSVQGDTVPELDGKTCQCSFSVPDGHCPFLANAAQRQVEEFQERHVARERAAIFGQLAEAHIDRLDRVGRVDNLADFRWVVEERDQALPVAALGLPDRQLLRIQFVLELTQTDFCLLGRGQLVDPAQVGS